MDDMSPPKTILKFYNNISLVRSDVAKHMKYF